MKKLICAVFLVFSLRSCHSLLSNPSSEGYDNNKCPKLYPKKFISYAPVGNLTAANYIEKKDLKGLKQCVLSCCVSETCNVAFIFNENCYHLVCVSDELCLPLLRPLSKDNISMILVKPVLPNENWSDILDQARFRENKNNYATDDDAYFTFGHRSDVPDDEDNNMFAQFIKNLPHDDEEDNSRSFDKYRDSDGDMIMDATSFLEKEPCEVDVSECPYNSECIPIGMKTRNGICKCVPGTEENAQGACVPLRPYSKGPTNSDVLDRKAEDMKGSMPSAVIQNLTVSILSKEVQLPENEVTLAAYTIPDEKAAGTHYGYTWTLVDQPKDGFTGNMKQNGATMTLTDLTEGQYRFKVTVNGTNAYGEGFANVTVLPPKRTNKPPLVVITPQSQNVKLPNSVAVLDGSASKDDDAIISWHWELTAGPISYQPRLQDGPTLVLNDLKQPGNYTFKLTIEDSDHVVNSTTANITVLNHTDYPPEANAGQDIIIYLPKNNLTLNGSLSTDDHEITSWEWTKAAGDENKAVDMQNTNSPYLQLSNLSEGMYTFVLKVTDSSGQASTAEVHVFVKPPTNTPPVAEAGNDIFISLPQTWVTLNGSTSSDDHRIVAFTWKCTTGPAGSTILHFNESVANATGLTKGQYVFTLTVLDDNGNSASDNVTVTVTQNKNSPPKANAGGDQVLSLPVPVLTLNGSASSDDFRVVSWRWTRAASGLAAGKILLGSDTKPVLMLTNIEAGRYVFDLTVTDDQGESDRDTVSVQVKPDPLENSLLELTLNVPVATFTQSQLDSLVQKMTLLLKDDIKVNVTEVRGEIDSGNTQIIFFLWAENKALHGNEAFALVEEAGGAGYSAVLGRLRTVRCLSACSGRGTCEQATRACRCDPFWMQSLIRKAQPDCEWSVVYASLGGVVVLGAMMCAGYGCARRRLPRPPHIAHPARPAYRLLPRADRDREARLLTKDMSDTDTDSDVLFESQKTTSFTRVSNGELPTKSSMKKNGHFKLRKVKT